MSRSKEHLRRLLLDHVPPAPVLAHDSAGLRCTFVRMGFPSQRSEDSSGGGPAAADAVGTVRAQLALASDSGALTRQGFACPRCTTVVTEIPAGCPVCGLELIASAHLSRSYHHLFPVPRFRRAEMAAALAKTDRCSACQSSFVSAAVPGPSSSADFFQCPRCDSFICDACELFVHETLHNCPACLQQTS